MKYKFLISAYNGRKDTYLDRSKEVTLEVIAINEEKALLKAKELLKRQVYEVYRIEPEE